MKAAEPLALTVSRPVSRIADYAALVRPRIAIMVLVTVTLGGLLAADSLVPTPELIHAVAATALVTAAASILNQWLERETDALMPRTAGRPLPAGRVAARDALALGIVAAGLGFAYMLVAVPQSVTAGVTAFTFFSYVFLYTPLKTRTTLNTLVGAIPGAMPPVIGWTAVTGSLDAGAIALFLIVYIWQVPHFLAIAWRYRDEYGRAGLRMLPVGDRTGDRTAQQMLLYGLALIPVSLVPVQVGIAGPLYAVGAGLFGALFLWPIGRFQKERSPQVACRVVRASLVYLPGVLATLLLSKYWV